MNTAYCDGHCPESEARLVVIDKLLAILRQRNLLREDWSWRIENTATSTFYDLRHTMSNTTDAMFSASEEK